MPVIHYVNEQTGEPVWDVEFSDAQWAGLCARAEAWGFGDDPAAFLLFSFAMFLNSPTEEIRATTERYRAHLAAGGEPIRDFFHGRTDNDE